VLRYRTCDGLITRPRSPAVCKIDYETEKQMPEPKGAVEPVKKKIQFMYPHENIISTRRTDILH
jgi:hypothetical protein